MAGYITHKENVQNRLKRIEGQVRGLQRMVDEEKYCIDILTQINSVQAALEQVSLLLTEDHMRHCVVEALQQGDGEEKITEIMAVLKRYSK
jgi:DNA-binding FrmR family transcriptional regulator